jgi:hypothetical protein
MDNWTTYVKYSYQVILSAEHQAGIQLDHDTEAYVVHLFANYIDKPHLNKEPVCIKLLEGLSKPAKIKYQTLRAVGDECLLIHGLELGKPRWPSGKYYRDIGQMAYTSLAKTGQSEQLFEKLAVQFDQIGNVFKLCQLP